jgi:stage III sporulation protein AG
MKLSFFKSDKLLEFIKKYKYILLIGLCGAVLLMIPVGSESKQQTNVVKTETTGFDVEEYEKQLAEILSEVEGVGNVKVMLSLKSGVETVYAVDSNSQSSKSEGNDSSNTSVSEDKNIAMRSGGSGDEPVVVKTLYPEFNGAIVVCDGAEDVTARYAIIKAVASITGLGTDKITVLKRS